ncbi:MAG: hypothetical protein JXP34_13455 [Planctomycetes bacterium]|nr:hypothetical protein [Planctomycetota bacterium]
MRAVRRAVGLALPLLAARGIDAALTLAAQPAAYWAGEYGHAAEASIGLGRLLTHHPLLYVAGEVAWAASAAALTIVLPRVLALIGTIAFVFLHTAGAATWLMWRFQYGPRMANACFIASAAILGLGIAFAFRDPEERGSAPRPARRLAMIAALAAIAAGLYLIPRAR